MWLLILITLTNAAFGSKSFLFEYRISVAGMPINLIDIMVGIGLFVSMFQSRSAVRTERSHPLLVPLLVTYLIALLAGAMMGLTNFGSGVTLREYVTAIRNFLALPCGVIIGYRLLANGRSMRIFPYVAVLGGCLTAFVMLASFHERSETYGIGSSLESLREIDYVIPYAGIAAAFLVFTLIRGVRLFPTLITLPLSGFCLLGGISSLSRSDWLSSAAGIVAAYACLPRDKIVSKGIQGLVTLAILSGFILGGVYVTSKTTGYDFSEKMSNRMRSLLPGQQEGVRHKAWDTRLYGSVRELQEFAKSPLFGRGFAIQDSSVLLDAFNRGTRHNSWTNALVETGVIGFAGAVMLVAGSLVVGYRMVRDRTDRGSVLMGALGVVTAAHLAMLGLTTGGFNNLRQGLLLGLTTGMVLRARMIQLAFLQEYAGYVEFDPSWELTGDEFPAEHHPAS